MFEYRANIDDQYYNNTESRSTEESPGSIYTVIRDFEKVIVLIYKVNLRFVAAYEIDRNVYGSITMQNNRFFVATHTDDNSNQAWKTHINSVNGIYHFNTFEDDIISTPITLLVNPTEIELQFGGHSTNIRSIQTDNHELIVENQSMMPIIFDLAPSYSEFDYNYTVHVNFTLTKPYFEEIDYDHRAMPIGTRNFPDFIDQDIFLQQNLIMFTKDPFTQIQTEDFFETIEIQFKVLTRVGKRSKVEYAKQFFMRIHQRTASCRTYDSDDICIECWKGFRLDIRVENK